MQFAIVDQTRSISLDDLQTYANAQQTQLRDHYASCYDGDGDQDIVRVCGDGLLRDGEFSLLICNSTKDDGALGEHDLSSGFCYLDLVTKYGALWTVTLSHECLESRADKRLHACVELDDGSIWDKEICDRVESDEYGVGGVQLSNFNTPECFEPSPLSTRFDWLGLSSKPNEVRPGGYAQRFDPASGWVQVGEMRAYRKALSDLGLSRGSKRRSRSNRYVRRAENKPESESG